MLIIGMESPGMAENNGGRVRFSPDTEVRILSLDGAVSEETYTVIQERSDRMGHAVLQSTTTPSQTIKVHHRRILPKDAAGKIAVTISGEVVAGMCPKCKSNLTVDTSDDSVSCYRCGQKSQIHWVGDKPMSEGTVATTAEKPAKAPKAPKAPKAEKAPKVARAPKAPKEVHKVDFNAIAATASCELWSKTTSFDHATVDASAHVLLYVGEQPRKFCFNTYNGCLGKTAKAVPVASFVADTPLKGEKKERPWYPVSNLEKVRAKLEKEGYKKVEPKVAAPAAE